MSKGLEALEEIKKDYALADKGNGDFVPRWRQNELLEPIEEELKEYEMMKQTQFIVVGKEISDDDLEKLKNQGILVGNLDEVKPLFDEETKKKLKALEIIKEKGLSTNEIAFIKNGESWETYVETMKELYWGDEHLDKVLKTKEEFDLLKEVML